MLETEVSNTKALRLYERLGFLRDERLVKCVRNSLPVGCGPMPCPAMHLLSPPPTHPARLCGLCDRAICL